jgi:hypothetical protein
VAGPGDNLLKEAKPMPRIPLKGIPWKKTRGPVVLLEIE